MAEQKKEQVGADKSSEGRSVKWDDSKMQTTYANVVNAASTREEVSIFFGTNQTWNVAEQKELIIQLTDRIVLNPYAAKRLSVLLLRILQDYEAKFGTLSLDNSIDKTEGNA